MQLSDFSGGLNVRQAPELIQPNEATICKNVDIGSGQLKSVKGLGTASITALLDAYYYLSKAQWMPNASTRDYLEYQGKLYWTDGTQPKKYDGTTTSNLGLQNPTAAPTVAVGAAGSLDGTLQYVYTYYNSVDGT